MRILCVHQGFELYGSDRCFADWVRALRAERPEARITVVLPRAGPLAAALAGVADEVRVEPLWVLRRRGLARRLLAAPVAFPLAVLRAWRRMRAHDAVYLSTSVLLDHLVAARFAGRPAIAHIHEIPEGRALAVLRALALFSGADLVFNSQATRAAFAPPPGARWSVVYNGIAGPERAEPPAWTPDRPLRLLLVGRINRIKGQDVLVEALARLTADERRRFAVRMIGGVFDGDTSVQDAVTSAVRRHGLGAAVVLEPFAEDLREAYRWSDVVVVPSQRPESLGRVAIEGMAHARPVIVSAIGGLVETVEDGVSGWRVPPGDAGALATALSNILRGDPALLARYGAAGRTRYERVFAEREVAVAIRAALGRAFAPRAPETSAHPMGEARTS